MRVLSFISGGYLPATVQGTRTSAVVHIADWYATFCGLAGKGTCPYLFVVMSSRPAAFCPRS